MKKYKYKKRSGMILLIMLVLGVSIGYAYLSKNLNINGVSGINKNTWDIHWDDTSVLESGNVTATTPAYVSDQDKKIVTFGVELELPRDYYEFTVDAKNYGTVDGILEKVEIKFYEEDGVTPTTLSNCLQYSFTHADGSEYVPNEVLAVGESIKYKFRLEFKDIESLECTNAPPIISVETTFIQPTQDQYKITFNPNGGTTSEKTRYINKGSAIGTLPTATKGEEPFDGWYTGLSDGTKITAATVPTKDTTYYAHWQETQSIFDIGKNVNEKMKTLAGDTINSTNPSSTADTSITAIRRSTTAPADGTTTEIISADDSPYPITAWFDNGTLYWYTPATVAYLNEDSSSMFSAYKNLNTIEFNSIKTDNVTDMSGMFASSNIPTIDLTSFNTINVTNMSAMFASTTATTVDLSSFNTSNVTTMYSMFASSTITTIDFSSFNTSNVTNMSAMFASSNIPVLNLSNFDTSKVTSISSAFSGAQATSIDISGWDLSGTTDLSGFMAGATKAETIKLNNVVTTNVRVFAGMFSGCAKVKSLDLSSFDVTSATNFGSMLYGCSSLETLDLSGWNLRNYSNGTAFMSAMAGGFAKLKTLKLNNVIFPTSATYFFGNLSTVEEINLDNVDTSNVTTMTQMFSNCTNLKELDLTSFNTKKVTNMNSMFSGNSSLETIIVSDNFVVTQVTDSTEMFKGCISLVGGLGTVFDADHIDKEYAHYDCGESDPGYFNSGETVIVTLNPNGGTVIPTFTVVAKGGKIKELPTPTKTGSAFEGWYTEDNELVTANYIVNEDMTIYAHYYTDITITYNANSGKFSNNEITREIVYHYDNGYTGNVSYQQPTRTGYKFLGWTKNSNGSGKVYETEADVINDIGNIGNTIYAKWIEEYTVTFNPTTGTVSETSRKVLQGKSIGVLPIAEKLDHAFEGWYTESGVKIDKTYKPTSNVTLYAHWNTIDAVFDTGKNVCMKFKTLAGTTLDSNYPEYTQDDNIKEIRRATTQPDLNSMTEANIVSSSTSTVPIYAWFDNGTLYWWSSADREFTNQDASYMFSYFSYLTYIDIPSLDTSITQNMEFMFSSLYSIENLDLSSLNTINVTNMNRMAYGNKNLKNISFHGIDTRNVIDMNSLLAISDNLEYVDFTGMDFRNYDSVTQSYGFITYLTGGGNNRGGIKKLILDYAILPADMSHGLYYMTNVEEISLKNTDTSNVTDMKFMFFNDNNLKRLDLSSFDTSNVTDMEWMFEHCYEMEEIDVSSFDTSNVTNMNAMFYENKKLKKLDLSNFDIRKVTSIGEMLDSCYSLEELDLSNWDFSNFPVTTSESYKPLTLMNITYTDSIPLKILTVNNIKLPAESYYYFGGLKNVEIININNPIVRENTNFNYLFADNPKLKEIHLENLDTSNVAVMENMFWNDTNLTTIYTSNKFKVNQVQSSTNMFLNATKIVGGNGTTYDANHVDKEYARVDEAGSPGYFTNTTSTTVKTITFNANGGTVSEATRNVGTGRTIGTLPIPYKKDATFIGWYTGLTSGEQVTSSYVVNTDKTIYARYTDSEFTITFDPNGGTSYETSRIVIEGKKIGTLPIPERNDYIFLGWTKGVASDVILDSTYIPEGNETLTAKWRLAATYTITFNANGGTVSQTTKTVKENKVVGNLPVPTYGDAQFRGWYTDLTTGTQIYNSSYITNDVTVYAKWRKNINWQTSSWNDIVDAYKDYNITNLETAMNDGTTREIQMDLDKDGTNETYHLRIANITSCSSSTSSKSACGFVVEFTDFVSNHVINTENTNVGGWRDSEMRTYLNDKTTGANSIYNALPSDLRSLIIDTNVVTGNGNNNSGTTSTTDKIYLFSPYEIFETNPGKDGGAYSYITRQLDYYKNGGAKTKGGSSYWTRTPRYDTTLRFYFVTQNGASSSGSATFQYGVAPAFRLADKN